MDRALLEKPKLQPRFLLKTPFTESFLEPCVLGVTPYYGNPSTLLEEPWWE